MFAGLTSRKARGSTRLSGRLAKPPAILASDIGAHPLDVGVDQVPERYQEMEGRSGVEPDCL